MHPRCPVCNLEFDREPGYFTGAMYVSYLIALLVFLVLGWSSALWLAPRWGLVPALAVAIVLQMLFVPWMWREARVIWAHLNVRTTP